MTALLILGLAVLVTAYILVGYPLLLAWLPDRENRVLKDFSHQPPVTVILAVHNGARFLEQKLRSILTLDYPKDRREILVVSDGSTDETEAIAHSFTAAGVRLLRQPHTGKAAALNLAIPQATGDILFFTDVRQPLDPDCLKHLAANFADPAVGAVTGEMKLRKPGSGEQADMDLYWRYELWVRSKQSRRDSLFNTTGCVYAMRRELTRPLREETLSDDAMLPLGAFFRGYRVIFDPQAVAWDQPAVSGSEFRRRWRNLAGLWQVHRWTPQLFSSANRMRWHFLSHKFARLVLPWALLTALVASWAIPDPWRILALILEAGYFGVVLLDPWISGGPLKRLTSPARTFLLMNLAALAAIAVFFVPPQTLWKPTQVAPKVPQQ